MRDGTQSLGTAISGYQSKYDRMNPYCASDLLVILIIRLRNTAPTNRITTDRYGLLACDRHCYALHEGFEYY